MKKTFHKIHLWLSVPFGLIITIICLSGSTLVFEKELSELFFPERYFVEQVKENPLPISELLEKVSTTLPDSVSVTGVNIPSDPRRAYQVNLSKPRRASVYVNQYTGEVKGRAERVAFFDTMFRLHRWLLDSMKPEGEIFWGKMIVGTSTLVFVFVIITGIIIWVPKTVKGLKKRLKISVNKGLKRFWHELHIAGGIYTAIILLVLALTGLTWSFTWYRAGFYRIFGVEMQQGGGHGGLPPANAPKDSNPTARPQNIHESSNSEKVNAKENNELHTIKDNKIVLNASDSLNNREEHQKFSENNISESRKDSLTDLTQEGKESISHYRGERKKDRQSSQSNFLKWESVFDLLAAQNPDFRQISISQNSANVSFDGWGNQRGSDRYTFDPKTGEITDISLYKDQDRALKIRGWIYSVHVGSWGGLFTRIITFVASLVGATLPLTGYYLWIKKSIKKRQRKKK